MVSQNEALTKDQANLERYRQNRVYQADRQSARTGSSSWPFGEILELDQTTAPANSTSFINGETRTGKDLNACLVRKQDTLVVIATGNRVPQTCWCMGT